MNKTKTIGFRVDDITMQQIQKAMKQTKRKTMSDFVTFCIEKTLEEIK